MIDTVLKQFCTLYAIGGNSGCWEVNTKTRGKPCDCELSRAVKATIAARDKWWMRWVEQARHWSDDDYIMITKAEWQSLIKQLLEAKQ